MKKLLSMTTLVLLAAPAWGQQVSANLSHTHAAVGQPVQLTVVVTGARGAQVPQSLTVDGLDARFAGRSESVQMQLGGSGGFNRTITSSYTYLILPLKQGDFTIPAIPVTVDGKTVKTAPLMLSVSGAQGVPVRQAIPVPRNQSSAKSAQPATPQAAPDNAGIAFGDLVIPKTSAYVGEVVPVELRFYFDAGYPVRLADRPSFSGDGFTVMPFSKPIEKQQEINGRVFNVVIFQTAVAPAKTGSIDIPAAKIETQIHVPGSSGMDDFFSNFFGNLGGFGEAQRVTVPTKPGRLEVRALPKEGRPEEFGGAIGQFSLQASADPKKAGPGDPITLTATVSGRGNFNAMGAPVLGDAGIWRTYPPSETFNPSPSDLIGFNGEKAYSFTIVARKDADKTPVVEFSFFDPQVEKYVTLRSNTMAIAAKGAAEADSTVAVTAAATPPPAPQAAPPAPSAESGLAPASRFAAGSFAPPAFGRTVLVANGALAVAWCAALAVGLFRMASGSELARRSALRREGRKLLHRMENCDPEKFYALAEEFVRTRLGPDSMGDVRELLNRAEISPETRAAIGALLDRHDETKYSTVGAGVGLASDQRREDLQSLRRLDHEMH